METHSTKAYNPQKIAEYKTKSMTHCGEDSEEISKLKNVEIGRSLMIPSEDLGKIRKKIDDKKSLRELANRKDSSNCYLVAKLVTDIIREYNSQNELMYSCNKIYAISADQDMQYANFSSWGNHMAVLVKEITYIRGEESVLFWVIDPIVGPNELLRIDEWMQILYKRKILQLKKTIFPRNSKNRLLLKRSISELSLSFIVFPPYFRQPEHNIYCFIFNEKNFIIDSYFNYEDTNIIDIKDLIKEFKNEFPLLQ